MSENEKELQLETLVYELDRLFDYKNDLDDFEEEDSSKTTITEKETNAKIEESKKFDHCKDQAFELLIKAEQLNEELESETKKSIIDAEKDVLNIFESFKKSTRYFTEFNLSNQFQINIDLVKSKKRLKTADFIGINDYKLYLDNVLRYLMDENDLESLSEYGLIENALIYGPSGTGKVSYLINLLIERNIIQIEENKIISSKFNIFLIDFDRMKFADDLVYEMNFLEMLLDSITESSANLGVLIVVKNFERLFDRDLKTRFIADLLYFMEKNSRDSILQTIRMNKSVVILMSIEPWLLPFAFVRQFRTRIRCGFLSRSDLSEFVDMSLKKAVNYYQVDWLCSDCLEKSTIEIKLKERFECEFERHFLTPKLILDAIQTSLNRIRNHIEEKFKKALQNKNLDKEDYDDYKSEYGDAIKRRLTLKRNSIQQWKNIQSRLLVMNLTGRSSDRRQSSLRQRESISTQQSKSSRSRRSSFSVVYDSLKRDIWKNETSTTLNQIISDNLNEFFRSNVISNGELEQAYKTFSLDINEL